MSASKGNLLPALLSGILLTGIPALAQEEPPPALEPPPSEIAFEGMPAPDLLEGDVFFVGVGDEMPVAAPIGPAGGLECQSQCKPIDLSDEQLEKIHSLRNDYLDAVGPKMVQIASKKRHLRDALLSSDVDAAKAKALQSEINSLKDEVSNMKLANKIDCLNVLTPEQRKTIRDRAFRWHGGHHHFGHGHGPGGPGGPGQMRFKVRTGEG